LHPDECVGALKLYARELDQHIAGLNSAVTRPQYALDIVCRQCLLAFVVELGSLHLEQMCACTLYDRPCLPSRAVRIGPSMRAIGAYGRGKRLTIIIFSHDISQATLCSP
jgi:hypothetical protein